MIIWTLGPSNMSENAIFSNESLSNCITLRHSSFSLPFGAMLSDRSSSSCAQVGAYILIHCGDFLSQLMLYSLRSCSVLCACLVRIQGFVVLLWVFVAQHTFHWFTTAKFISVFTDLSEYLFLFTWLCACVRFACGVLSNIAGSWIW